MALSRPVDTSLLVAPNSKTTYCRFCGKMSVARSFVNLQSNDDQYKSALTKLAYMNIKPARKLHMNVCQPCHEAFNNAFSFCQKFNYTQVHLANIYGSAQRAAIEAKKAPVKRGLEIKQEPQSCDEIEVDDEVTVPFYNKKKKQFVDLSKTWSSYKWTCCYCDFNCKQLSELRAHAISQHRYCYAFECPDCDIKLNEYEDFIEHVRRHKENLRYFCDVCNKPIPNKGRHHHTTDRFPCDCCGLILRTEEHLHKHEQEFQKRPIVRKRGNPGFYIITVPDLQLEGAFPACDAFQSWKHYVWACNECDIKFHSAQAIRDHSHEVHDGCYTMKCIDCNTTTDDFHSFILHIMRHRPSLRHFCPFCNRLAHTDASFREHVRGHLTNTSYCPECGQIFRSRSSEEEPRSLTSTVWFLEPPGANIELEERRPNEPAQPSRSATTAQPTEGTGTSRAHFNAEENPEGPDNNSSMEVDETGDDDSPGEENNEEESDEEESDSNEEEESTDEEESNDEEGNNVEGNNVEDNGNAEATGEGGDILHALENLIINSDPLRSDYALPFPTACSHCEEVFTDKRLYRVHTKTRYCLICDKEFSCTKNNELHLFNVHMAHKPYECYKCGRCYRKKSNAYTCMQNHLSEEMGMCLICESKVLKSFLAEHTAAHRYEVFAKQKVCGIGFCHQKFTSWMELVKHRHAKHLAITFRKVRTNGRYMAQKNLGLMPQDEVEVEI